MEETIIHIICVFILLGLGISEYKKNWFLFGFDLLFAGMAAGTLVAKVIL
jgi:hypothetical protein